MMFSIKGGILFLADPKRSDLYSLSNFMPKNRVQHDSAAICEMVSTVVGIMKKRYETMERERLEKESFQDDFVDYGIKPLVLVIEEMAAFVSSLDKKYRESFEQGIKDITMKGRQAGVFLCSVMQQPNANNISTESRSQMGLRVYLGKSGGIEYRMLFGEGREYPDDVCGGVGQGLYMLTGQTAQPVMLETPRMKKSQLATALKKALESQHDDLI
jgi:DNA segregation ATPase FtsK/SpoIIIE-like protein